MKKKIKRLVIFSDTPMWRDEGGRVNVYEATLREIEHITELFQHITWIGYDRPGHILGSGRTTYNSSIRFILLKASGGHTIFSKVRSIILLPYYSVIVFCFLLFNKHIHTRGPSVPAMLAVIFSFAFPFKTYWNKYGGNWKADNAPFFYRLHKRLLSIAIFSKVTINGIWPDQPKHVLSYENPCFTRQELNFALTAACEKKFIAPFTICFAGRLEEAKGVGNLLAALSILENKVKLSIQSVLLAGDGPLKSYYVRHSEDLAVKVVFLGGLNREQLNKIYASSHFMILPSASEGFPKVLIEAIAFGCIPIVTNISALSQFIDNGVNGFLMQNNLQDSICAKLTEAIGCNDLSSIAQRARLSVAGFTYEKFADRLRNEIFFKNG